MKKATIIILLLLICSPAIAETSEDVAINCILGEARGEDYQSMVAIAEFIRKNGHDRLIGCTAKIPNKDWVYMEKTGIIQRAFKAWHNSVDTNLVKNSTHFENIEAFGVPYWAKNMTIVSKVGPHTFYKENKS